MASLPTPDQIVKTKQYDVQNIKDPNLKISGKGDNPLWDTAKTLSDFSYPWETVTPPATTFKALHNKDWLYLLYNVTDENVNVFVEENKKGEVIYSDRVEIFFRKDKSLSKYYALEIDPHGRIMDYQASYHRKFDSSWSWPSGQLEAKAHIEKGGYIVEIAISKSSLENLGLLEGNQIEAGIFRANCTLLTGKDDTMKWISWMKPASATPDFHIPSAFGLLNLKE